MNEQNSNNNSFEVLDVKELNSNPDYLDRGLMRTQSSYTTSMQVLKPRNLNYVEKKCLEEAAIAGEEFIYQWPVKKKQPDGSYKKEQLIGLSVGAALAIARNMGNNAIDVQVEERHDCYIFYGAYIDLETGFNLRRAFRQRKEQKIGDQYKEDGRAEDIVFQIGQSKAIRNVALNAAPSWLTKKIQESALKSFADKVEKDPAKYKGMCFNIAKKLFIPLERIELKFGKETGWDVRKIITCLTELRTIEDGYADAENTFPTAEEKPEDQKSDIQPDQNKSTEKKTPEVQSVETEEKKPAQQNGGQAINLSAEDWEVPIKVIAKIESISDPKELASFKKENKNKLQSFSGKDHEAVTSALTTQEQKLRNGH